MCTYICSIFSGNWQQSPSKYFLKSERWEAPRKWQILDIYLIKFKLIWDRLEKWLNLSLYFTYKRPTDNIGWFLFKDLVNLCSDRIFIPVRDRNTREGKRRPVSAMSVNYPVRPYSAMTGHDDDIYDEDQWVSSMSGTTYIAQP